MRNTYLTVPFAQKDKAKALGARWDGAVRQWYVPAGLELTLFRDWLAAGEPLKSASVSQSRDLIKPLETPAATKREGVSLSQLLAGVEKAVTLAFQQGVWT